MDGEPRGGAATKAPRAWAEVDIDQLGIVSGEVIGFSQRLAVVALATPTAVPVGRAVWLSLGLDGEQAERTAGSVVNTFDHVDGRRCVAIELVDVSGAARRSRVRVPFRERVEVLGITDQAGPDPRWRATAFDLSTQGLGVIMNTEIRVGASVLLRFPLPPHRHAFQVRATVTNCRSDSAVAYATGFLFERVTAGHAQQLHAAIINLAAG